MRFLTLLLACLPLPAAVVTYDASVLLTPTSANQLGDWLGEGDLHLTRIYFGDPLDALAFHAAADGQGRTFTVIEALTCTNDIFCILSSAIIGGYNPQSWSSSNTYNLTPLDSDRTGFIFNLTESRIARQILGIDEGQYQTYNVLLYGPTFGGVGHDLFLCPTCGTTAYGDNFSYGPGFGSGTGIAGANASNVQHVSIFTIGRVEVFTIGDAAVPEPGTGLLGGAALAGLLLSRRRFIRR